MSTSGLRSCAILGFVIVGIGITAACGDDETSTGGGGPSLTTFEGGAIGCPAGTKECISDSLARVCPSDGSAWLSLSCRDDEKCVEGACVAQASTCSSIMDTCVGNTALKCKDGRGFEPLPCPAGTQCIGAGKCTGACEVGASACSGTTTLTTCTDGLQQTSTACPVGTYCVSTGTAKAECKVGDCSPGTCDACGNKVDPTADQTKFISQCKPTPLGYKWQAVGCTTGASCNPKGGGSCAGPYSTNHAACTSACVPGATRCSATLNGIQTCNANGQWEAAVTACNPVPASYSFVCMTDLTKPNSVICGDPLCANGEGQCQENGQILRCGPDRKVGAVAEACATGTCTGTGQTFGGRVAGNCLATCQAGDERCVTGGGISYQQCNAGTWGAPQTCATGTCYGYTSTLGRPARLCNAVCNPGTHRCSDAGGSAGTTHVQTCDAAGQWGAAAACAFGTCQASNSDFICLAQCIPGSTVCMGSAATGVGQFAGTDSSGICTAEGRLPAPTACDGTKVCRKNYSGIPLGCLECVGTNHGGNAVGQADSRCTDPSGAPGGVAAFEYCQANDTWPAAPVQCPGATTCTLTTSSCGNCSLYNTTTGTNQFGVCSESRARSISGNAYGCSIYGFGSPTSCGLAADCCSSYCSGSGPSSATCK